MREADQRRRSRLLFVAAMSCALQLAGFLGATAAGAITATASDSVYARGTAQFFGSPGSAQPAPTVAISATPTGHGYRTVNAAGTVSAFGDATWSGNGPIAGNPIVGLANRPAGGYWLLNQGGQVLNYGGAPFLGSAYGYYSYYPFVAIVATPDSNGYWLFSANGGVWTFGSANYYGSAASYYPSSPIVAAAATPNGDGYYVLRRDGGLYIFGNAPFLGSGGPYGKKFVAIAVTPDGNGYWLVAEDGTIDNFGTADAFTKINKPTQPI